MIRTLTVLLSLAAPVAAQLEDAFDAPWIGYDVTTYPSGYVPSAARMADLDGDGVPDLAASTYYSNPVVSVVLARGDGGLAAPVLYPVPLGGADLALADLDGDGDVDLAVPNSGQFFEGTTFNLLRNRGDGSFEAPVPRASGNAPNGMAAADLDNDGDVDLAISMGSYLSAADKLRIVRNHGDGSFDPPVSLTLGNGTNKVAAGHLDDDGWVDLVVAREGDKLNVLMNSPIGFQTSTTYSVPAGGVLGFLSPTVSIADVDLDGDGDVLYSGLEWVTSIGHVALLRNPGNGALQPAQMVELVSSMEGAVDLAVADVTGDGWPDLLGTGSQSWALAPGDGRGGFGPAVERRATEDPVAIEAIDLDGDGDRDVLVMGGGSAEAAVYRNPGDGSFPEPEPVTMTSATNAPASSSDLDVGDIDGNGTLDAVVAWRANFGSTAGISVRRGNGDGSFGPIESYAAPEWFSDVLLRDLDGDGDLDLLLADGEFPYRLRWKLNDGTGTFGATVTGPPISCGEGRLATMDANGDGLPDALWTGASGCFDSVFLCLNTGGGYGAVLTHSLSDFATAVAAGDMDGDGHQDLITNSAMQGWLEVSPGHGDGTFGSPLLAVSSRGSQDIVVDDFDLDGIPDLASCGNLDGTTMAVLLGWGDGQFKPPATQAGSMSDSWDNVHSIVSGDVDGDGFLDLMVANKGSQDVSFWRGRGDGTFDAQVRYGVGEQARDLVFGDFTGDGIGDLLVEVEPVAPNGWYYPALVLLPGRVDGPWTDLGQGLAGAVGTPSLSGDGTLQGGTPVALALGGAAPLASTWLVLGLGQLGLPFKGGVLVPTPDAILDALVTSGIGTLDLASTWPLGIPQGSEVVFQAWITDAGGPKGLAASNGLKGTTP